jgi:hypothetical protein
MLKFIQKWLHNKKNKKYGFGWLYLGMLPIILTLLSMIIDNEKAGSKYTHNLDN